MADMTDLQYLNRRHKSLFDEFKKIEPKLRDIKDYINPYLGFFDDYQPNEDRNADDYEIINSAGIYWSNVQASGMQWGITSPTRPWIKLSLPFPQVMRSDKVLAWLDMVKNITLDILARSNFYPSNHQAYLELGVMGTAAMLIEEDSEDVINCRTFTAGEFALGLDKKGRPNAFARNMKLTVFQIVEQFGLDNVPLSVKMAYENKQYDTYRDVKHLICPNPNFKEGKMDNKSMKFRDVYWMQEQNEHKYLSDSGRNEFPVMVARGDVVGPDIYGRSSGHRALSDSKSIQIMEKDILTATELGVKPSVQASKDVMMSGGVNLLPAGVTYYNPTGGSDAGVKTTFQVNLDIEHAQAKADRIEAAIKRHFNGDMWLMISDMEKGTRTAREVIELASEKMTQLGPMLERLQTEYLPMVVDRVFAIGQRLGVYPPPPEEIAGMPIKVEYESILSQAQNQYIVTPILDTVNTVMQVAGIQPEVVDKIDWDEVVDQVSQANGVPPSIIMSDDRVAQIRQARQKQMQMEQMMQMGLAGAQGAKQLAGANMEGDNALTALVGRGSQPLVGRGS